MLFPSSLPLHPTSFPLRVSKIYKYCTADVQKEILADHQYCLKGDVFRIGWHINIPDSGEYARLKVGKGNKLAKS